MKTAVPGHDPTVWQELAADRAWRLAEAEAVWAEEPAPEPGQVIPFPGWRLMPTYDMKPHCVPERGRAMRAIRKRHGLGYRPAAEAIGIDHTYLYWIERGYRPSFTVAEKFAKVYYMDRDRVFGILGYRPPTMSSEELGAPSPFVPELARAVAELDSLPEPERLGALKFLAELAGSIHNIPEEVFECIRP